MQRWIISCQTRRKYVHVGSSAASMPLTVCHNSAVIALDPPPRAEYKNVDLFMTSEIQMDITNLIQSAIVVAGWHATEASGARRHEHDGEVA